MNRYRIVLFATAVVGLFAHFYLQNDLLVALAVIVFVAITALGVSLPHWQFFGPFICFGNPDGRRVALTFDDGPDPQSTPALLDLLRERNVTATFFCIGKRVEANPELAARIVREGHEIENHSFAHSNMTNFFTVPMLKADLMRARAAIKKATGASPKLFRPPMGLSNPALFYAARRLNLTVIGWTARGFDTRVADSQRVVARIMRKLSPGGIILLHDGKIPRERLITTITTLLDALKADGYEPVRLDKLLK